MENYPLQIMGNYKFSLLVLALLQQANLLKLKISPNNTNGELLDDNTFKEQNHALEEEINGIGDKLSKLDQRLQDWTDLAVDAFNFACYAKYHFTYGEFEEKKKVLLGFGSKLIVKDRKIIFDLPKHLEVIDAVNNLVKDKMIKFETDDFSINKTKNRALDPACMSWLRIVQDIRTIIQNYDGYIYIPDLRMYADL